MDVVIPFWNKCALALSAIVVIRIELHNPSFDTPFEELQINHLFG
jgi:hypothetical protein